MLASAAMVMSSISVLSNALRLRRFRRPATVQEILHPPVRARVGQYAYLTGVAVVALAIGGTLTAVSRMDFAERGMNGQLAWIQSTGMPMRPAMSEMMTAEVPATEASEAGLNVRLDVPDDTRAGVPTRVTATVLDTETGEPVEDLTRSHQAWMHFIATREDLGTFTHVHPEPTGRPGELAVEITFPTPGRYIVNTEFRRQGQMDDVHQRQLVTVSGAAPEPVTLAAGPRVTTVDGIRVELGGEARAGEPSDLHFAFTDAATGRPVDDLQPFLAAAGHVVVMRADGSTFAHEHAEVEDDRGRPVFAMPGQTFGPELDVHAEFDTPGIYRLWGQFRLATATSSPCRSPSRRPDPSQDRPARTPRAGRSPTSLEVTMTDLATVLGRLGGRRGLIDGAVPPLLFAVANAGAAALGHADRALALAVTVAGASALALGTLRRVQGTSLAGVLRGLLMIVIAAAFALWTGRARDFFLPGMYVDAAWAVGLAVSAVAGHPLVGHAYAALFRPAGRGATTPGCAACWRSHLGVVCHLRAARRRAGWPSTGPMSQGLLAVAKLALGWPLTVGCGRPHAARRCAVPRSGSCGRFRDAGRQRLDSARKAARGTFVVQVELVGLIKTNGASSCADVRNWWSWVSGSPRTACSRHERALQELARRSRPHSPGAAAVLGDPSAPVVLRERAFGVAVDVVLRSAMWPEETAEPERRPDRPELQQLLVDWQGQLVGWGA